jgi:hypothetical protein
MLARAITAAGLALALASAASTADAEVVARSENGFTLRFSSTAAIDPANIPRSMTELPLWWDGAHSYTGEAANLSLDLTPGGCWCEKMPDGTDFDHGRTVSVAADRMLFAAPFGPLRGKTTRSDLEMTWAEVNGGRELVWVMTVEGAGVGAMADAVDFVMGAGFQRWIKHLTHLSA